MKRVVPYIVLALAALLPVQCASAQSHRGRQHTEREDVRQYRITRQEYIKMYKDLAIAQMKRTGIPASIILAQACLESGNGNSYLAREGNNHFGIKCHGWQGAVIYRDDDAPDECFRRYDKVEDSFADHSDFLRYRDRYAPLFELPVTDYRGWAYGLQKAGYATAGNYAEMLVRIIEENDLDSYDRLRKRAISKLPPTPAEAEVSEKATPKKKSLAYRVSLSREVFVRNGANYIVAESYDSYSSIAAEYNLFVKELLRFNDLKKEQPLREGDIVYITRKGSKAAKYLDAHVIEEWETMHEISQRYAVRLKSLYKYNNLRSGREPLPGTLIKLRPK